MMKVFKFSVKNVDDVIWMAIVVGCITLLGVYYWPNSGNSEYDNPSSEGKTAVGTIKAAVDTYRAKMHGDISSLNEPTGLLAEGFAPGSKLLEKLRIEDDAFAELEYWDPKDFTLEFVTDGKDGFYIIKTVPSCDEAIENSGPITYNSQTQKWTEKYNE